MTRVTPGQLAAFLQDNLPPAIGWRDRLKISYRPFICPFDDLLGRIRPGESVFDVGCGSGQFCLLAARYCSPSHLWGLEIAPHLTAQARRLFQRAGIRVPHTFLEYDGASFPSELAHADVVTLIDVLHHIPPLRQPELLRRLHNTMKAGSRLLLKDIEGASPLVLLNRLHDRIFAGEVGHELSASAASELARRAGFTVTSIQHRIMWGYPHFLTELHKGDGHSIAAPSKAHP